MTNLSRKQRLKGDDAFIHAADEASVWLGKHRHVAIGSVVAVVLLLLAGLGVQQLRQRRNSRAAESFAAGFRAFDGRVVDPADQAHRAPPPAAAKSAQAKANADANKAETAGHAGEKVDAEKDAEVAEDEDLEPTRLTFDSDKARLTAAHSAFLEAEAIRGHAGIGTLAGLLAADLEVKLNEPAVAERHFDALRHDLKHDERLYFLAVERYAYLCEARGDLDGALAALGELAQAHKNFYADRATLHQVRIYEAKGEIARAVEILEAMQQNFPRTTLNEEMTLRLEALGDATAKGAVAPPGHAGDGAGRP